MEFRIILEPATLRAIEDHLSALAHTVSYQPGTLTIDGFDPANETDIVEAVASLSKPTSFQEPEEEPYIDWLELTRHMARTQRAAAAQEKETSARLRAKRRRQETFTISL